MTVVRHSAIVLLMTVTIGATAACGQASGAQRLRVLITNDNGIEDEKIHRLALAFRGVADTWVVASASDQSGMSSAVTAARSGTFRVKPVEVGEAISAFALDGRPADCVLFALSGPLRSRLPDLVISGINGGANAGDDWISSGTIGAARVAAHFGIPALAVSGIVSDNLVEIDSAAAWVVRLATSPLVRQLRAPQYLTVSFPERPLHEITGVELVRRGTGNVRATGRRSGERDGWQEWTLTPDPVTPDTAGTDLGALARGKIAIVAMRAGENDAPAASRIASLVPSFTAWPMLAQPTASPCPLGLSRIDDVEDPSGREWGVMVLELADGLARAAGFRERDIITSVNGVSMASGRGEPDPDDKLVAYLQRTECGAPLSFVVVRGQERLTLSVTRRP